MFAPWQKTSRPTPLVHPLLKSYKCMAVKWALPSIFPLVSEMKSCYIVLNLLNGVTTMMCPPMKVMAGYPEDMDQDKHDDSTDDSDAERSDGESEGDEFVHHDHNERNNNEENKSGLSVQFAVCRYAWEIKEEKEH